MRGRRTRLSGGRIAPQHLRRGGGLECLCTRRPIPGADARGNDAIVTTARTIQALAILAALISPGPLPAQDAAAPDAAVTAEELMERIEELKRSERDPLREQLQLRREALGEEADINPLRYDLERAEKAYETRAASDPLIRQARQAVESASEALPALIRSRLAGHPRLQVVQSDLEQCRASSSDLLRERAEVVRQLASLRNELADTPALQPYHEAAEAAEAAYRQMPERLAPIISARKAMAEARSALDARIEELPEKKAYDAAAKAYHEAIRNSPELRQAREARQAAAKAYSDRAEQVLRVHPKGAPLYARLDEIEMRQQESYALRMALDQELSEARRELEQSDPEIAAAKAALEAARKRHQQVLDQRAGEEKRAIEAARKALNEGLDKKVSEDVLYQDISERYTAVNKKIMDLYRRAKALRRGETPEGEDRRERPKARKWQKGQKPRRPWKRHRRDAGDAAGGE